MTKVVVSWDFFFLYKQPFIKLIQAMISHIEWKQLEISIAFTFSVQHFKSHSYYFLTDKMEQFIQEE